MKTSTKILTALAGVIIVFFITSVLIVRQDLMHYLRRAEVEKYKTISTDTFQTIHLSAQWDVKIRPGQQFKVQIVNADTSLRPKFENIKGTLYLKLDSASGNHSRGIHARIIAPSLRHIVSTGESSVNIEGFTTDSLNVTIDDGCTFTGKANNFKFLSFKSTGDARIELTEVPDF